MWLQLLAAWANRDGGILATDAPRPGLRMRLTGQRFFQSRYDGPGMATVAEPVIGREAVAELLATVVEQRRKVWGRISSAGKTMDADSGWLERSSVDPEQYILAAHPIILDACSGEIGLEAARSRLAELGITLATTAVAPAAHLHPQVTAVAARLGKDTTHE